MRSLELRAVCFAFAKTLGHLLENLSELHLLPLAKARKNHIQQPNQIHFAMPDLVGNNYVI